MVTSDSTRSSTAGVSEMSLIPEQTALSRLLARLLCQAWQQTHEERKQQRETPSPANSLDRELKPLYSSAKDPLS